MGYLGDYFELRGPETGSIVSGVGISESSLQLSADLSFDAIICVTLLSQLSADLSADILIPVTLLSQGTTQLSAEFVVPVTPLSELSADLSFAAIICVTLLLHFCHRLLFRHLSSALMFVSATMSAIISFYVHFRYCESYHQPITSFNKELSSAALMFVSAACIPERCSERR